jgi:hypothetical protein
MTPDQVRKALGPPRSLARQVISQGHREQWLYPRYRLDVLYGPGHPPRILTVHPLTPADD